MAIYVPLHKLCFIHNPKTGGSSIQNWLFENTECIQPKKTLHCGIDTARKYFPDIKTSFVVVRNPWDWCVSWYHYQIKRAQNNIEYIQSNPNKLDIKKEKYNLSKQNSIIEYLNLGFENWLENTGHSNQIKYTKNIDIILRFENLNSDFRIIQDIVNVYVPLPIINTTNRNRDYKIYYNKKTIDLVYNKYREDIKKFGYEYETS